MYPVIARNLVSRILPVATPKLQAINVAPLSTSRVCLAGANEMLEVGPWPRTKEERMRAAKKYNLIPEDYEPYDQDQGFGDYPKLKAIGAFNRDPYDDYDDPVDMRFYGEVYHIDQDMYHWERMDPLEDEKRRYSYWVGLWIFLGTAAFVPTLMWIFRTFNLHINHDFKNRYHHPKDQKYYEFPVD